MGVVSTNPCDASSACTRSFTEALLKQSESGDGDFCDALTKRSDGDLAICEVDIRNSKFEPVIAKCKTNLVARLKNIVAKRNYGLKIHADVYSTEDIGLNFKLESHNTYKYEEERSKKTK